MFNDHQADDDSALNGKFRGDFLQISAESVKKFANEGKIFLFFVSKPDQWGDASKSSTGV